MHFAARILGLAVALFVLHAPLWVAPADAGLIGGGNEGRCEMLESETGRSCVGRGKRRVCTPVESYCGGTGSDGSCSCAGTCLAEGNCCGDFAPVCANYFQCTPDSGQIAFLHVGGMCSENWDSRADDRLADVSGIANAVAVDVQAVQTEDAGTEIAARTLRRYLDACCTGSNSCIVYNYSNGDPVTGYALDKHHDPAWNLLEVRASSGNGGGSELSNWGFLADLFACDLASQINPTQLRNLYDHNATQGVPYYHMGGFLDQGSGSDEFILDAGWLLLPWHSDGAVAYHSAGARNDTVEWCGDGNDLEWDWTYFGFWCTEEDLCSSRYGTTYQGHSMAYCPMEMENSDHYDQKMEYIHYMGQ